MNIKAKTSMEMLMPHSAKIKSQALNLDKSRKRIL